MQSLDKCGAIPDKDIDCLKSKCLFWDNDKGMCVLDMSMSMLANIDMLTKIACQKWLTMNNSQRLDIGIDIAKKLGML